MTIGIYAGSFDPFHRGHLAFATAATRCVDHLVIAITTNPAKPTGRLTADARTRVITASTAHLTGIEVVVHHGLLADLAQQRGADVFVRSMGKEQAFELQMAVHNFALCGTPTVFLAPAADTADISSTRIRRLIEQHRTRDAAALLAPAARTVFVEALVPTRSTQPA